MRGARFIWHLEFPLDIKQRLDIKERLSHLAEAALRKPLKLISDTFRGAALGPSFESEILPAWLQAIDYDLEDDLYILEAGGRGFGFIGRPLSGIDPRDFEKLQVLLGLGYPGDTVMSFCLWTSPDVEHTLATYKDQRRVPASSPLAAMRDERISFVREGASASIVDGSDIRLHNAQLVITVKVPTGQNPSRDTLDSIIELRKEVEATLKSCGFRLEVLTAPKYLRFMQTVFNWKPDAAWRRSPSTEYTPDFLLTEQILDPETSVEVDEDGLSLGDQKVRLLSVKRYSSHAVFGQAFKYIGDAFSGARGIRDPLLVTFNIWFGNNDTDRSTLSRESAWLTHPAGTGIARWAPRVLMQKHSSDVVMAAVEQGDRLVRGYLGLAVMGKDDAATTAAISNAITYMREFGLTVMRDKFFCAPLFANLLPFGADVTAAVSLRRFKRWATRHVIPLLPIASEWAGTGTPSLLTISRNGQLMGVSNWDSDTNYNCIVAAQSGSGKSFMMNDYIANEIMRGGRVWCVDKGKSYRNICELLGGQELSFGPESTICLNPFTRIIDYKEDADMLYGLISTMAALREPLSNLQTARVKQVMHEIFNAKGNAMLVDDLAAGLIGDDDQRVRDVGHQLYPFTQQGEYGRWFYGQCNYQADANFVLVELDELDGRQHLQRVVLLQLIFQIQRDMYLGERDQKKILVIDEAWELLEGPETGVFIERAYRRFRKYNGAAFTITQSCMDYFRSPSTLPIFENSAYKLMLGQSGEALAMLEKEERLAIGQHGFNLMRTLRSVQGQYSEIFFHTPMGYGIGRLVVPELTRFIYSTTPDEVVRMGEMRKEGLDLIQAAQVLRQERSKQRAPVLNRLVS